MITVGAIGNTDWNKELKIQIKRAGFGKLEENCLDRLSMCLEMEKEQEALISLCTKQNNRNHHRAEQ